MFENIKNNNVNQKDMCDLAGIIDAFGGFDNILAFNNSVSQLRYDVKDLSLVDVEQLKKLGASEVKVFDGAKHVQATFPCAEELNGFVKSNKEELKPLCNSVENNNDANCGCDSKQNKNQECASEIEILAPVSGKVFPLSELNDGVFSEGLVGNGFGIRLENKTQAQVIAPFDGKITMMPANKSQFILSNSTLEIEAVIVLGKDSYKLDGIGFESFVKLNDSVKAGDKLFELDLNRFNNENINKDVLFVLTQDSKLQKITNLKSEARVNDILFTLK
ncbi:PTS glucose transporter subunit IIA [Mycoplasmopsis verecunda]|uniref:PTS system, glucose-like IIB component n=1 Tax=Mycoplasmopsis verecunda TaxID=171291 RepID=A0A1T4MJ45_9BACT|nr:PTS glucose transporter subunit IIA [Mycoplasmopsis verecunda]WPB54795.1 PTS glucose transporter subunit IIA [Mycoplasmopsis verecunda]SJZ67059.1 PTS system, glucose-like IIB component [Mycoplasmopsis verecunda]